MFAVAELPPSTYRWLAKASRVWPPRAWCRGEMSVQEAPSSLKTNALSRPKLCPPRHVNVAAERCGGRVIDTYRQPRTRTPCLSVENPNRAQAVAGGIKPTHDVKLSAGRRSSGFLKRHGQGSFHALRGRLRQRWKVQHSGSERATPTQLARTFQQRARVRRTSRRRSRQPSTRRPPPPSAAS